MGVSREMLLQFVYVLWSGNNLHGEQQTRAPHREGPGASVIAAIILCCSQTHLSQVMKVWVKVHSPMGSPRASPISLIPKLIPLYRASAGEGAVCVVRRGVSLARATMTLTLNKRVIFERGSQRPHASTVD